MFRAAPQRVDLERLGLFANSSAIQFFDVLEAERIRALRSADTVSMDLERSESTLTSYELAIHDSLFEHCKQLPATTLTALRASSKTIAKRTFNEAGLEKSELLRDQFQCLPPVRVFGEAEQVFDMYSQGKNWIVPQDLQNAYKRSFNLDLSPQHASALIVGLQNNPRPPNAPPAVTRCEFMRGYLAQRGYLSSDLTSGIDTVFNSGNPSWTISSLMTSIRANWSREWKYFLSRLFMLDRMSTKERMSKCEIGLLIASCRTHLTTHFMAASHAGGLEESIDNEHNKIRFTHHTADFRPWATYKELFLFPQTTKAEQAQLKKAQGLLSDLFVTHDADGNSFLSRDEFSNMIKTMDMWQDLKLAQDDAVAQRFGANFEQDTTIKGDDADYFRANAKKQFLDISFLLSTPLMGAVVHDEALTEKLAQVWDSVKTPETGKLSTTQLAKMLNAEESEGNESNEADTRQAVLNIGKLNTLGKYSGQALTKENFLHSMFNMPNLGGSARYEQILFCSGMVADDGPNAATRPTRSERRGKPISSSFDRQSFSILIPLWTAFDVVQRKSRISLGSSFHDFASDLKVVLPRLSSALDLQTEADMRKTYDRYAGKGASVMVLSDFAKMFAEEALGVDGLPKITVKSFVFAPLLRIPHDSRTLSDSDELEQGKWREQMSKEETTQDGKPTQ